MVQNEFKKLSKEDMKQISGGFPPPEDGCFPDGTVCTNNKRCNFDSSIESCLCGSVDDGSCYKA